MTVIDQATKEHEYSRALFDLECFVDRTPQSSERTAAKKFLEFCRRTRSIAFASSMLEGSEDADPSFDWYSSIREGLSGREVDDGQINQLVSLIESYEVPQQFVFDFIRGVAMEKSGIWFADFSELRTWAYLTSGAPWLAVLKILGAEIAKEEVCAATMDLGSSLALTRKLSFMTRQFEWRHVFLCKEEWIDRGIELDCQVEPFDDRLWQDLIQFQCARIEEKFVNAGNLKDLLRGALKKNVLTTIRSGWALLKKIRRDPQVCLREEVQLTGFEQLKLKLSSLFSAGIPVAS